MKLCRFELITAPERPRSGIVYGSKVYETDGSNPVGVYEWSDVRLLSPIGQPPSVRLFGYPIEGYEWENGVDVPVPPFQYLNPSAMIGPGLALPFAEYSKTMFADPCIAVIIGGSGRNVPVDEADGLVLGLTLVTAFHIGGGSSGRSFDAGFALGPAITTPDELDDAVTVDERGRRYRFSIALKVNTEETLKLELSTLPYTIAELLSAASESCSLHQGDIVIVSMGPNSRVLEKGDQVQTQSEKLGTLTTRIA